MGSGSFLTERLTIKSEKSVPGKWEREIELDEGSQWGQHICQRWKLCEQKSACTQHTLYLIAAPRPILCSKSSPLEIS